MQIRSWVLTAVLVVVSALAAMADAPTCEGSRATCLPLVLVHDGEHWGGGEVSCPAGYTPLHFATRIECAPIFGDAGRSCTAGSQCLGECLATYGREGGTCTRTRLGAGCFEVLLDGGERVGLCID